MQLLRNSWLNNIQGTVLRWHILCSNHMQLMGKRLWGVAAYVAMQDAPLVPSVRPAASWPYVLLPGAAMAAACCMQVVPRAVHPELDLQVLHREALPAMAG
jgi:hypothetical protein